MRARKSFAVWAERLRRRRGTLPLRLWLLLAVVAITGAGFLAQVTMTVVVSVWEQQATTGQLEDVRQVIGTNVARWHDPAWQLSARKSLADLGVEAAVFQAQPRAPDAVGPLLFATAGAAQLWDSASPEVGNDPPTGLPGQPSFQRIIITADRQDTPTAIALLWYTRPLGGGALNALWPLVELGTFALTLALVLWLIGQPVLRPLAAMSQAAEAIAGGDLSAHLPTSPVREIADVGAALEGMSTSLREALARQEALEQERRLFVGAVAHDLRTPLFMLRGSLKGLEAGVAASPQKIARYVAVCQTQANLLERLVGDLFAYTRLEHLELAPQREHVQQGTLVRQAVEAATPLAMAKGITLRMELADDGGNSMGDVLLLTRAIENLLDNALRYTPEGGTIRVTAGGDEHMLTFSVEDSGPGLAAHDLPHLFTPLYRGEASRNRETGGAGLGLAIAARILQAHGGSLTAANRAEGGAIFTGTIPAVRRTAPSSAAPGV